MSSPCQRNPKRTQNFIDKQQKLTIPNTRRVRLTQFLDELKSQTRKLKHVRNQ